MVLEITGNAPGFPEHDKTLIMEIKHTNTKNAGKSKKKKDHNT
jgi:hypothetical protein